MNVFKTERASFTFQDWSELNNKNFPDGYAPLGVQIGLQKLNKKITELIKSVKQQNSKIYLLIYPWPGQLYFGSEVFSWEEFITKVCEKNECDGVINLFPEFVMEKKLYKDWYFKLFLPGDIHFNKYGNKIVAKKIFEKVINNID